MKIGIIGSGMVAQQLGLGFLKRGDEIKIGTRSPEKLTDWQIQAGRNASVGNFDDAAKFGDLIILATRWENDATRNAIELAGKRNLEGKILIDVTNPLIFKDTGQPPSFALGYPESAGKTIQQWLPQTKVVKAFNIVTAYYMANPKLKEGILDMFIAGNDQAAKNKVKEIATGWGWPVHDIGEIEQSYLLEALAMLWVRYGFLNNHWKHGFRLLKE